MKTLNAIDELGLIKKALTSQSLESHFDKHDNTHIEAEIAYTKANKHFLVETYFFLPQTMGFYQKGFSAKKFLQSTTNFIRLKSPEMLISEFLNYENSNSPLAALMKIKNEMLVIVPK